MMFLFKVVESPDLATTVAVIITAVAALAGLAVSLWITVTDRAQHKRDLVSADHRRLLLEVTEQYARYLAGTPGTQNAVGPQTQLKVLLRLMPDGTAALLKWKLSVPLGDADKRVLVSNLTERGKTLEDGPSIVEDEWIYEELRDNAGSIAKSGREPKRWKGWQVQWPVTRK